MDTDAGGPNNVTGPLLSLPYFEQSSRQPDIVDDRQQIQVVKATPARSRRGRPTQLPLPAQQSPGEPAALTPTRRDPPHMWPLNSEKAVLAIPVWPTSQERIFQISLSALPPDGDHEVTHSHQGYGLVLAAMNVRRRVLTASATADAARQPATGGVGAVGLGRVTRVPVVADRRTASIAAACSTASARPKAGVAPAAIALDAAANSIR